MIQTGMSFRHGLPESRVHGRRCCPASWTSAWIARWAGIVPIPRDALETVTEWLVQPEPRFVLMLGDFGTGKSFLLHMLALRLAARDEGPTPVLIEMRGLQKARTLDELVAQHLSGAGETRIDLQAFRYMLAQGRIALLFDGFDELTLRVTYERAAEHFDTLIEAAAGQAKLVMTSRTQHFESEHQVKSALAARAQHIPGRRIGRLAGGSRKSKGGPDVQHIPGRRIGRLAGFGKTEIRRFLVNRYGDETVAEARFDLIEDIRDLSGLACNPRMLGFIADLPEEQLRQAKERTGEITAAALYELLIERWLKYEQGRAEPRGALPALSLSGLWEGVTQLALRLWQQAKSSVRPGGLHDEAALLIPHLDPATAAHQLGSGTLPDVTGYARAKARVTTLQEEEQINTFLRLSSPSVIAGTARGLSGSAREARSEDGRRRLSSCGSCATSGERGGRRPCGYGNSI